MRNGRPWINGRPSENVVDEKKKKKKLNGCTFSAVQVKISHAVYRLHDDIAYQMSLRYRYWGENEGLVALFATIISLHTKKRKIML